MPNVLHAKHSLGLTSVARGKVGFPTEATLAGARFLLQQVRAKCLATTKSTGTGHFDPLAGPAVGLHLRHGCYTSPSLDAASVASGPVVFAATASAAVLPASAAMLTELSVAA